MTLIHRLSSCLVTFFFLLIQACSTPPLLYEQSGNVTFNRGISSIIQQFNLKANIGIEIRSISSNKTLFSLNKNQLLTPASNVKIFTTAIGLNNLGPDYKYVTQILAHDKNMSIRGTGDPSFSLAQLDSLANLISQKTELIDTLYLDDSYFENIHYGNGWMWDEGSWEYSAPISALNVNQNCVKFIYSPNGLGKPVHVSTEPNTKFISVLNESITVNDTIDFQPFNIERDWKNQSNLFEITGELFVSSSQYTVRRNIFDPTLYTGTLLKEMLNRKGVKIGEIRKGQLKNGELTFEHQSDSLYKILTKMMYESQNLIAESVLKTVGVSRDTIGSSESGINNLKSFLADLSTHANIDTSNLRIVDGSGLSRYNLVSPSQIVDLLIEMKYHQYGNYFMNTFPHGGQKKSTLEERLISEGDKIIAKTGSISGVSTLSGYANSKKHGPLAFSIMMNGFVGSSYPYKKLQDQICKWLVN